MKKYIFSLALLFSIINLGSNVICSEQNNLTTYNKILIKFKNKDAYNSFLKHASYNQNKFEIIDTEGNEFEFHQKAAFDLTSNQSIIITVNFFNDLTKNQIRKLLELNPDNAKILEYYNIDKEEEINDPNDERIDDILNDPSLFLSHDLNQDMNDEEDNNE